MYSLEGSTAASITKHDHTVVCTTVYCECIADRGERNAVHRVGLTAANFGHQSMSALNVRSATSRLFVHASRRNRLQPFAIATMPTSVTVLTFMSTNAPSSGRCRPIHRREKSVMAHSDKSNTRRNRSVAMTWSGGRIPDSTVAADFPDPRSRRISSSTSGPQARATPISPTRLHPAMRNTPIAVQEDIASMPSSPMLVYDESMYSMAVDFEVALQHEQGNVSEREGLQ